MTKAAAPEATAAAPGAASGSPPEEETAYLSKLHDVINKSETPALAEVLRKLLRGKDGKLAFIMYSVPGRAYPRFICHHCPPPTKEPEKNRCCGVSYSAVTLMVLLDR